jgi:hypothetical protein
MIVTGLIACMAFGQLVMLVLLVLVSMAIIVGMILKMIKANKSLDQTTMVEDANIEEPNLKL